MLGKTLSHYKVIEKIGQGGTGEVYRAEDTNLSREVAIKVLPEQFTKDPQRLVLFGALYQGGAELAFEIPKITREMVVVIQGLVILFCGALEFMLKPQIEALFRRRPRAAAPAAAGD